MELNLNEIEKADKELSKGYYKSETNKNAHINVWVPKEWMESIERMVAQGRFFNKSEAIRHMIRYYFDIFGIDFKPPK